jgi:hypothetical protein
VHKFIVIAVAIGALIGPGAARAGASISTNWSGYGITKGGPFNGIFASDVRVPKANCALTTNGTGIGQLGNRAALWIGLGGANTSMPLVQAGILEYCTRLGAEHYALWYEIVTPPGVPGGTPITTVGLVHAGDRITLYVYYDDQCNTCRESPEWTFFMVDEGDYPPKPVAARGCNPEFFGSQQMLCSVPATQADLLARTSAEVITERPLPIRMLHLTDFGQVKYSGISVEDTHGHESAMEHYQSRPDQYSLTGLHGPMVSTSPLVEQTCHDPGLCSLNHTYDKFTSTWLRGN